MRRLVVFVFTVTVLLNLMAQAAFATGVVNVG